MPNGVDTLKHRECAAEKIPDDVLYHVDGADNARPPDSSIDILAAMPRRDVIMPICLTHQDTRREPIMTLSVAAGKVCPLYSLRRCLSPLMGERIYAQRLIGMSPSDEQPPMPLDALMRTPRRC
jgi:hypothetical protein